MNIYKLNRVLPRRDNFRIIYYHTVSNNKKPYHFNHVRVENFKKQIDYFSDRYNIISLNEALKKDRNGENLKDYLSITTDDGFVENYDIVAPILSERNLNATFFLIEDTIDNKTLMWRNKLLYVVNNNYRNVRKIAKQASIKFSIENIKKSESIFNWADRTWPMELKNGLSSYFWDSSNLGSIDSFLHKNRPYMSTDQINELLNKGFDIGVHTKSHPFCDKLDYKSLYEEIIGPIDSLSLKFNRDISLVSYPFGVRPVLDLESKLIKENKVKCLLGINNKMENGSNTYKWERDRQECKYLAESWFRYALLPYFYRAGFSF